MPAVTGAFPYNIDNLLGGAGRVLYTDDISGSIPTGLEDIIDLTSPYAPNAPWEDLGATVAGSTYSRGIDTAGYEIQQATGLVMEEITETTRSLGVDLAEIKPDHLQIIEEATAIDTIAPQAGVAPEQSQVKFGSFADLTRHRVALLGRRNKASGEVDEGTIVRGRFVALVLYNVAIAADSSEFEFAKGDLVHAPVTFISYPESGESAGEEYGTWFLEEAGTI